MLFKLQLLSFKATSTFRNRSLGKGPEDHKMMMMILQKTLYLGCLLFSKIQGLSWDEWTFIKISHVTLTSMHAPFMEIFSISLEKSTISFREKELIGGFFLSQSLWFCQYSFLQERFLSRTLQVIAERALHTQKLYGRFWRKSFPSKKHYFPHLATSKLNIFTVFTLSPLFFSLPFSHLIFQCCDSTFCTSPSTPFLYYSLFPFIQNQGRCHVTPQEHISHSPWAL